MSALWRDAQPLVLGSRSSARRDMLVAAGIPVELCPADIDERAVEAQTGGLSPDAAALLLANEKALATARLKPDRVVVGADQTLALGDRRFSKPKDRAAAHAQLSALAGQTHALHSAVAVVQGNAVLFSHVATARLTMRALSEEFLDAYLDAAGAGAQASVGGYQLETLGIHLFERIEGDHFTILGMPLLPLLAYLRDAGLIVK